MKNELKIILKILSWELRRKDIWDRLDVEFLNNDECNIFRCDSDEELKKWAIYYLVEFLTRPTNTKEETPKQEKEKECNLSCDHATWICNAD